MKKQSKIPYDEATADAIIAGFNLNPAVKKVWRTRGHIPGHYLDENRDDTAKLSDHDPEYQRFREILADPRIAATKFRTLGQKGADIGRGKDRMTEAERIGFKTEITELRNKIRLAKDVPTNRNLVAILTDLRLHPTKIIPNGLYDRIKRDMDLLDYEKNDIRVALLALYNFLRI